MLTFMVANKSSTLFIIDEPDIYLHSDLQRQLVSALRALGPDILIATHSTEILLEADANEILTVAKGARSAKRIADPTQLHKILEVLGSNINPFLTELARSKRLVFVEGKDFQLIARFANKLGLVSIARRSGFAIVPANGFNPVKVKVFREGVEATSGSKVEVAVIFDRDYRTDREVSRETSEMMKFCTYVHIHSRKELENFLLVPSALERAVSLQIAEQNKRTASAIVFSDSIADMLQSITDEMKHDVQAQYLERHRASAKAVDSSLDDTSITSRLLTAFDEIWNNFGERLKIVPGKSVLSSLNTRLQSSIKITVTSNAIIDSMIIPEVSSELKEMLEAVQKFVESK